MTRHLLVVCTGNVSRSPVVAALLARCLAGRVDVDGARWSVSSAGTLSHPVPLDQGTITAAGRIGLDISDHRPRHLDRHALDTDGADLVLTLARQHLRYVTSLDRTAWPRTFTLKEFARRAATLGRPGPTEGFEAWRQRMSEGRRSAAMLSPDPADDVADPYGLPLARHIEMVTEVASVVDRLVSHGPWVEVGGAGAADDAGDQREL